MHCAPAASVPLPWIRWQARSYHGAEMNGQHDNEPLDEHVVIACQRFQPMRAYGAFGSRASADAFCHALRSLGFTAITVMRVEAPTKIVEFVNSPQRN